MSFNVIDACNLHQGSDRETHIFNCSEFAVIGQLVRLDTVTNTVIVIADNQYEGLCIGQIISKPTSTQAEVQVSGKIVSTVNDLEEGKPVFIRANGTITTIVQTPPCVSQVMGVALSETTYLLKPESNRVKRI